MVADMATELERVFKTKTPTDISDIVNIISESNDEWSADTVRVLADATRDGKISSIDLALLLFSLSFAVAKF